MAQKYELRWRTFPEHAAQVFKDLGTEGNFADVTLVSDDHIQSPAHKVVISACSPVLKKLLINNPHSHPMLYLRGIKNSELQALIKFMYFGEVQMFEEQLKEFIDIAKDLKVEQIFNEQDKDERCSPDSFNKSTEEISLSPEVVIGDIDMNTHFNEKIFEKSQDTAGEVVKPRKKIRKMSLAKFEVTSEGKYKCLECESLYSSRGALSNHVMSKHRGIMYSCDECTKSYSDRTNLRTHKKKEHEIGNQSTTNIKAEADDLLLD